MGRPKINEVGNIYGRLYVEEELKERTPRGAILYNCKCECGNYHIVAGGDLRTGRVNSCGCYRKECVIVKNTTHGQKNNKIYKTYYNMINRCYNKNVKSYSRYGGRGVIVHAVWLGENGFENFYKWSIENGYTEDLTIDRIDNNGNYEPNNCRWVDLKTQANNKSNNRIYKYKDKIMTAMQWSEFYNVNYKQLLYLLDKTRNIEKSLIRLGVDITNE